MSTFITITDPETDPEAPLTSELAKKWRDNPAAVHEGDVSVPNTSLIRALAMRAVAAGSQVSKTIIGYFATSRSQTNGSTGNFTSGPTKMGEPVTTLRAGTITVSAQLRHNVIGVGATGGLTLDVFKNGTSVLTLTSTSSSYTTFTGDVTFAAGDVLELGYSTTGTTGASGGTLTTDIRLARYLSDISTFFSL